MLTYLDHHLNFFLIFVPPFLLVFLTSSFSFPSQKVVHLIYISPPSHLHQERHPNLFQYLKLIYKILYLIFSHSPNHQHLHQHRYHLNHSKPFTVIYPNFLASFPHLRFPNHHYLEVFFLFIIIL